MSKDPRRNSGLEKSYEVEDFVVVVEVFDVVVEDLVVVEDPPDPEEEDPWVPE